MKIALDFDGTYTADPSLWDWFIQTCIGHNHHVYIVTFRTPEDRKLDHAMFKRLEKLTRQEIVFTDRTPKRAFCESMGLQIDIWIDDNPSLITEASDWTAEDYAKWKAQETLRAEEEAKEFAAAEKATEEHYARLVDVTRRRVKKSTTTGWATLTVNTVGTAPFPPPPTGDND